MLTVEEPIAVIGAGAAGLITAHTLLKDGFKNVQIITHDADVGGVWSTERVYPGLVINKYVPPLFKSPFLPKLTDYISQRSWRICVFVSSYAATYERFSFWWSSDRRGSIELLPQILRRISQGSGSLQQTRLQYPEE
jgi:monoamine oxidase